MRFLSFLLISSIFACTDDSKSALVSYTSPVKQSRKTPDVSKASTKSGDTTKKADHFQRSFSDANSYPAHRSKDSRKKVERIEFQKLKNPHDMDSFKKLDNPYSREIMDGISTSNVYPYFTKCPLNNCPQINQAVAKTLEPHIEDYKNDYYPNFIEPQIYRGPRNSKTNPVDFTKNISLKNLSENQKVMLSTTYAAFFCASREHKDLFVKFLTFTPSTTNAIAFTPIRTTCKALPKALCLRSLCKQSSLCKDQLAGSLCVHVCKRKEASVYDLETRICQRNLLLSFAKSMPTGIQRQEEEFVPFTLESEKPAEFKPLPTEEFNAFESPPAPPAPPAPTPYPIVQSPYYQPAPTWNW